MQPQTQITELKPEAITKASAIQRGGRAARRGKGGVFRLYFEEMFENLRNEGMPAYQTDLAEVDLVQSLNHKSYHNCYHKCYHKSYYKCWHGGLTLLALRRAKKYSSDQI